MCLSKLKITDKMTDKQIRNRVELYVMVGYIIYLITFISLAMLFK